MKNNTLRTAPGNLSCPRSHIACSSITQLIIACTMRLMFEASLTMSNVTIEEQHSTMATQLQREKKQKMQKINSVNINKKVNTAYSIQQSDFQVTYGGMGMWQAVFFQESATLYIFTFQLQCFLVPAVFYFSCRNVYQGCESLDSLWQFRCR